MESGATESPEYIELGELATTTRSSCEVDAVILPGYPKVDVAGEKFIDAVCGGIYCLYEA